jgi:hypothetical protein
LKQYLSHVVLLLNLYLPFPPEAPKERTPKGEERDEQEERGDPEAAVEEEGQRDARGDPEDCDEDASFFNHRVS